MEVLHRLVPVPLHGNICQQLHIPKPEQRYEVSHSLSRKEHCSCTVMSAWLRQKQRGRTTQGYCSHAYTQETSIRIKAQDVMQPSHLTIWMYLPGVHSSSQTAG